MNLKTCLSLTVIAAAAFGFSQEIEPGNTTRTNGSQSTEKATGGSGAISPARGATPRTTTPANATNRRPSVQLLFTPTPMFQICFRPDVMQELNITTADRTRLGEKMLKLGMPDVRNSGDPEGAMRRWLLNQNQVVIDGLEPNQRTRLTELYVQYNGFMVLNEFDFAKKLSLSEDVRAKIKSFFQAANKKIKDSYNAKDGQPATPIRSDDPELRKEVNAKIKAILSEGQIAEFEKLKGKEFKFGAGAGSSARPPRNASGGREG